MKNNDLFCLLNSAHFFDGFCEAELLEIIRSPETTVKHCHKDQVIHLKNEPCYQMDVILSGQVAVLNLDENGNMLIVNVFEAGDSIGENLLFAISNGYPMTVVAATAVTLLQLEREQVVSLCQKNADFLKNLLQSISEKTMILTDKLTVISLKTVRQRINDYLSHQYQLQQSPVITLGCSKKELAERLGVQRTSLSRELAKMKKAGLLDYDAKTITIKA
ncbi:Crp/Fnr family transcriptional regulator [Acetobacterium wieringae]|uniref:Crp/Fnr family transcriptional regulator n=1 Tax=Acetobacterium wieringae TaxID=52694 RepID=UPI0026EC13D0|nr:Crp/Fnr family transcriptional regulator [Acetobacterium wieringae]